MLTTVFSTPSLGFGWDEEIRAANLVDPFLRRPRGDIFRVPGENIRIHGRRPGSLENLQRGVRGMAFPAVFADQIPDQQWGGSAAQSDGRALLTVQIVPDQTGMAISFDGDARQETLHLHPDYVDVGIQ